MALIESGRKSKRKRLRFSDWNGDPDDDESVDVPAIVELDVKDPKHNNQGSTYRFNNTQIAGRIADRDVRVQTVQAAIIDGAGVVTLSDSDTMDVERVNQFGVKDAKSNNQESRPRLRGDDPPPTTPDNDDGGRLRHRKTHYIRFTKDNTAEGRPAVDVELIDECETRDPKTNAQESVLRLRHPDPDTLEQIVDASDPYAVNYDLRLGFCDPDLELYEEGVSDNIDPPFRLDPFMNVVNVLRDTYRFVGFLVLQHGSYVWTLQFVTPKAFVSEAEINAAEANDTLVPAPVFGEYVDTPTDPLSVVDPGDEHISTEGDQLLTTRPQGGPLTDYHGYIDLVTYVWVEVEGNPFASEGPHVYFDYKELPIEVADIPAIPAKGRSIASDEFGTVFARLYPPDGVTNLGFTKYDADGNVLWNLQPFPETYKVISADESHPAYIKMFYTGHYIQEMYDLNGNYVDGSGKNFDSQEFNCQDISRKGRYYGFKAATEDGVYDDIVCYSEDATTLLWTIAGEPTSGYRYASMTAYAEDYLVVQLDRPTNDTVIDDGFIREHEYGYRVYNAHDGSLVSETILPTDSSSQTGFQEGSHTTVILNQITYGGFVGMYRNRYWP